MYNQFLMDFNVQNLQSGLQKDLSFYQDIQVDLEKYLDKDDPKNLLINDVIEQLRMLYETETNNPLRQEAQERIKQFYKKQYGISNPEKESPEVYQECVEKLYNDLLENHLRIRAHLLLEERKRKYISQIAKEHLDHGRTINKGERAKTRASIERFFQILSDENIKIQLEEELDPKSANAIALHSKRVKGAEHVLDNNLRYVDKAHIKQNVLTYVQKVLEKEKIKKEVIASIIKKFAIVIDEKLKGFKGLDVFDAYLFFNEIEK